MILLLRSLSVLLLCVLPVPGLLAQSYIYNFEAPVFTAGETTPILNRQANIGDTDFTTSFTSNPNSNGFTIGTLITAPLSGLSLLDSGLPDTLTLTFSRPVSALSFGAAIGAIANQANGRVNLNWGTGSQDFSSFTQLPNNFQVSQPSITFPIPITSVQITAFNGANAQVSLHMDNLNITAVAVPEPATMLLLGTCLLGTGYVVYRWQMSMRTIQEQLVEDVGEPVGEIQ